MPGYKAPTHPGHQDGGAKEEEVAAHEAPAGGAGGKKRRPAAKRGGARRAPPAAAAAPVSPERSASSSVTESSVTEQGNTGSSGFPKEESFTSSPDAEEFQFDESFWSETLSMPLESFDVPMEPCDAFGAAATSASAAAPDDMDYWLRVFMESGDVQQELPQI